MRHVPSRWCVALSIVASSLGFARADDLYSRVGDFAAPTDVAATPCAAWESEALDAADESPTVEPNRGVACRDSAWRGSCRSCGRCGCRGSWLSGFELEGWIDQGVTFNPASPRNRFNGPVTFNDRSNDYQLNQFWLGLHREVDPCGPGVDVGGGIDFNYGTDSRFFRAYGIDELWSETERFYGLSMPQFHVDLGWRDWKVRMGHFATILGHEVMQSPENFFYSHSYLTQYGAPLTHTGVLAGRDLGDRISITAGFTRGWDNWDRTHALTGLGQPLGYLAADGKNRIGFLGGVTLRSLDRRTSLGLNCTTGARMDDGDGPRVLYSLVFQRQVTDRLQWVLQHNLGFEDASYHGGHDENWYGLANYLYYDLNSRWRVGLRHEWFSDDDGARVRGLDYPHGIAMNAVPTNWQEISLGLHYAPNDRLIVRSECRWDWSDPLTNPNDAPFDDFTSRKQFLFATDLIVKF